MFSNIKRKENRVNHESFYQNNFERLQLPNPGAFKKEVQRSKLVKNKTLTSRFSIFTSQRPIQLIHKITKHAEVNRDAIVARM